MMNLRFVKLAAIAIVLAVLIVGGLSLVFVQSPLWVRVVAEAAGVLVILSFLYDALRPTRRREGAKAERRAPGPLQEESGSREGE